ncbi:hypothetical protein LR48_Vigan11g063500 [Vigna angularis]|uniref:Autophagy-related protein 9 n=1 Tax=Phaseolus angularis TaxID=3914 RepID=A0A0L9VRW0_PHAAN|nr:hypothetical protein LR48_Vigan11g063500 [Vigna angularis]
MFHFSFRFEVAEPQEDGVAAVVLWTGRRRDKESTKSVHAEFATLFRYTRMMLLEEAASIFHTPYLLLFIFWKVDDILLFIADFTVNVEGVGHVCGTFDFQEHGKSHYGFPYNAPRNRRSSQGKMEKSLLRYVLLDELS